MSLFASPDRLYFFFDYISHNAWLAWNRIGPIAVKHGLTLEPVPVLFGALLKTHGQMGPAEIPPKSRWMLWNVLRKAQQHGIPIAPPFSHPFNPLLPLRVSCIGLPREKRLDLIQRLFAATWVQSRAVHEESVIAEVLAEAGLDAQALLEQAHSEEIKAVLRSNTNDAIGLGVFGVPSMRARSASLETGGAELFWGFDDLENLEAFLSGRDPLDTAQGAYEKWFQVKFSVQRKR